MENWKPALDRPGYRCQTIQRDYFTAVIYRPIQSPEQEAVVHEQVKRDLTGALTSYYHRTGHLPGENNTRTVAG